MVVILQKKTKAMNGTQLVMHNALSGATAFDDGGGFTASNGTVKCKALYLGGHSIDENTCTMSSIVFTGTLNGMTATQFTFLDQTSSVQGQLDSLRAAQEAFESNIEDNYVTDVSLNAVLADFATNALVDTKLEDYARQVDVDASFAATNASLAALRSATDASLSNVNTTLATCLRGLTNGTISTSTLDPGAAASVSVTVAPTSTAQNLIWNWNFGIPQGYKGDKGDKGSKGDDGSRGERGPAGSDGTNGSDGVVDAGLILGIIGAIVDVGTIAATAAAVVTLQTQLLALQTELAVVSGDVSAITTKTSNLQAVPGVNSTFTSPLRVSNGLVSNVVLNPSGTSSFALPLQLDSNLTASGHTQVNTLNVSGNVSSSLFLGNNTSTVADATISHSAPTLPTSVNNQGTMTLAASTINVGSASNFSTVNISGLNINLTGILTINGIPYAPLSSFFSSTGRILQVPL